VALGEPPGDYSLTPLAMLAPALLGYAAAFTGVGLSVRGETHFHRAIDAYNGAATAGNKCPP